MRPMIRGIATCSALLLAAPTVATPPPSAGREAGERHIKSITVPAGLAIDLFASEPQLANPVAIAVDEGNRVFVAEEYRFNAGSPENRTQGFLLDDDLQVTTLEQRRAMLEKHIGRFPGGWDWFTQNSEQLRLVEDRDGDGRADHSTVYADGFNQPLTGLASGVIARDGDVWFSCLPALWRLRDRDGDGVADDRAAILEGFGVNASYFGHDLHGLAWGPDGRLYFTIGDRGFDVRTREGTVAAMPRRGAVFRCLPDGSEFEVVHVGLRNPQELAFDAHGNLFAADNNSDHGDHSRLVLVVEGGDSGWDMAYQTIPAPYQVGPWKAENMFHVDAPDDAGGVHPAWILPPVGKLCAGPSGFAFYPGVGLPDRYRDHFFLCNYAGRGTIESFAVRPKGAAFEIVDTHEFLAPAWATDVEFGYDGRMYVSDFVVADPWGKRPPLGRLYRVFDPRYVTSPEATVVRVLFAAGFAQRGDAELATLLRHPDMRARQRAQFALAAHGPPALPVLRAVVADRADLIARLHGLWGLGQIAREHREVVADIAPLLADEVAEVRGQAARLLGDLRAADHGAALVTRLADADPRVRMHAALALGRLRHRAAVQPLLELARTNADQDRYVRHAVVVALAAIDDRAAVAAAATDKDVAVRLATLLVMRRWRDPRLAGFLDDPEIRIVTEAARAIHDLPLAGEPAVRLARAASRILVARPPLPEPLERRLIDANFRLAGRENVELLAEIAASPGVSVFARVESIQALSLIATPVPRNRVTGVWSPNTPADRSVVRAVLDRQIAAILAGAPDGIATEAARLVEVFELQTDDTQFVAWVNDATRPASVRTAALALLVKRRHAEAAALIDRSLADPLPEIRAVARDLVCTLDPDRGVRLLDELLARPDASRLERQRALTAAAAVRSPSADVLVTRWAERLAQGEVPADMQLDVIEAATARKAAVDAVARFQAAAAKGDPLARFGIAAEGGDADRGREVFAGHTVAQCVRCHKVRGEGGDAGPELTQVAGRLRREQLLESLITPDAMIAPGFGSVSVVLDDGAVVAGVLKAEDARQVTLTLPDGTPRTIPQERIEDRSPPRSPMPAMDKTLTPRELRDVIEYLSTLR